MDRSQVLAALEELSRDFAGIAANACARSEEIREGIRKKIIQMCGTPGRGEEIATTFAAAKNAGRSSVTEERLAAMIALEFIWPQEKKELISLLEKNLAHEHDPKVLQHTIECAARIVSSVAEPGLVRALQRMNTHDDPRITLAMERAIHGARIVHEETG